MAMTIQTSFLLRFIIAATWIGCCPAGAVHAQVANPASLPAGVPLLHDDMPPGMVGAIQLQRQPALRGFFQPVEFRGLDGMKFALVSNGMFTDNTLGPARAAFLVGPVYRFRMTNIPNEPEAELFPTLEVIDRTYPPSEREHRFPIIVDIDQTDIDAALRGDMVTRVIYLEDSTNAEPVSYAGGPQRVFDIKIAEDSLRTADYYGRPLAILRIGSRIPDVIEGPEAEHFVFGSPPWLLIKNLPKGKTLSDASNNK